jgi:hypothetical protein
MLRASLGKVVHTVKRTGTYTAKVPPQELHKIAVHARAVIHPPPPLHPASVSSPRTQGRGYTLAGRWGDGGSIFRKTPDIGLASYSIIPLRGARTMLFVLYV